MPSTFFPLFINLTASTDSSIDHAVNFIQSRYLFVLYFVFFIVDFTYGQNNQQIQL